MRRHCACVGTCDGTALAWVLGRKDGKPVGLVETSTLGSIFPVEDTVGAGDGSRLGLSLINAKDGDADGDRDGSELIEGNTDCTGVGFPDGTELGLAVGPSVRLRVGNRFGTALGRLLLLGIALGERLIRGALVGITKTVRRRVRRQARG